MIQDTGGTRKSIAEGQAWIEQTLAQLRGTPRAEMGIDELIVGTKCGGSDATSGLTANPAMGRAFDFLVEQNAACIFEETGELIGMENWMAQRAATPELGQEIINTVAKAARYYATLGHASFAPGNADGGLTTIEEKSLGAYAKSGQSRISGIVKPGDVPITGGLYLDGHDPRRRSALRLPQHQRQRRAGRDDRLRRAPGHVLYRPRLGGRLGGLADHQGLRQPQDLQAHVRRHGRGRRPHPGRPRHAGRSGQGDLRPARSTSPTARKTKSEALGHQEFVLMYKSFEPLGASALSVCCVAGRLRHHRGNCRFPLAEGPWWGGQ